MRVNEGRLQLAINRQEVFMATQWSQEDIFHLMVVATGCLCLLIIVIVLMLLCIRSGEHLELFDKTQSAGLVGGFTGLATVLYKVIKIGLKR